MIQVYQNTADQHREGCDPERLRTEDDVDEVFKLMSEITYGANLCLQCGHSLTEHWFGSNNKGWTCPDKPKDPCNLTF